LVSFLINASHPLIPAATGRMAGPAYGAAQRYIRNHMDLGDLEQLARFPPVRHRPHQDPTSR
jgi:hypothetical protein